MPSKAPCGTRQRYWAGCRCDDCRAAATQYARDRAELKGGWPKRRKSNTSKPHRSNQEVLARNAIGQKQCNRCWEWQAEDCYYSLKTALDGLSPQCRICERLRKHKLTRIRITELLADQGNRCGICPSPIMSWSDFEIDHDHTCCPGPRTCGECVRGLLCKNCNFRVMALLDDQELVQRALIYAGRA